MIDMHVHYFPERVFRAIWTFFENRGHGLWSVRYRLQGRALVDTLKSFGVTRFTTLVYAHKPDMADWLNAFVADACAEEPAMLGFGTVFAGDGEVARRALRLFDEYGFHGVKMHPFVSGEEVDDARFFPLYEIMAARGRVLVCHPGSGPVYAATDGAQRLRRIVDAFPALKIVVAHCGAFEYGDYEALAAASPHVWFDTAMNCVHTAAFPRNCPGRAFFERFPDRVVFGSDYPNIPYAYEAQVASLRALGLGAEAEAALFDGNARRLLGLAAAPPG